MAGASDEEDDEGASDLSSVGSFLVPDSYESESASSSGAASSRASGAPRSPRAPPNLSSTNRS